MASIAPKTSGRCINVPLCCFPNLSRTIGSPRKWGGGHEWVLVMCSAVYVCVYNRVRELNVYVYVQRKHNFEH